MHACQWDLAGQCLFAQDVAVEMMASSGVMDARDELREGHADVRVDRLRFF